MQRQWSSCVITLDTASRRYQQFSADNSHMHFEPFMGVKGVELTDSLRVASGLATRELVASGRLSDGAAGCAASHRRLWERAATSSAGMLIVEDDAILHPGLAGYIDSHHPLLVQTAITYFGVNTDSVLQVVSPQGLTIAALQEPKHPSPEWVAQAFSLTDPGRCELWRLLRSFGTCCYYVSPHGAATLLKAVFPLSLDTVAVPFISDQLPCSAIDRAANRVYPVLPAFVTMPFLAYSANTDSSIRPAVSG